MGGGGNGRWGEGGEVGMGRREGMKRWKWAPVRKRGRRVKEEKVSYRRGGELPLQLSCLQNYLILLFYLLRILEYFNVVYYDELLALCLLYES